VDRRGKDYKTKRNETKRNDARHEVLTLAKRKFKLLMLRHVDWYNVTYLLKKLIAPLFGLKQQLDCLDPEEG
jgi:hypothetical protein